MSQKRTDRLTQALRLLDLHYESFRSAVSFADETGHPVPSDTRGWSRILLSILTGIDSRKRKKGTDFIDGSDVKGANTWEAIDTPRFNGAIKAGTKALTAGKLESLDHMPFLFFVLWDYSPETQLPRCRVWCVQPRTDKAFRDMCNKWYANRIGGSIISTNFQLHPPRNKDTNEIRNTCGNLPYPLLLWAERGKTRYEVVEYDPDVLKTGACRICGPAGDE